MAIAGGPKGENAEARITRPRQARERWQKIWRKNPTIGC
jgi:hypothetical protein